jgi:copper transport protein
VVWVGGCSLAARKLGWLLLVLLLAAAAASFGDVAPTPLEAHALLRRADPPVNSQVREPPTVLTLYFTETLERRFSTARVVNQDGQRLEDGVEFDETDDTVMRVRVKPLQPGYITVFWENVSAVDGHRISGSYPITILNPDGSVPPGQPSAVSAQVQGEQIKPTRVFVKALLLIAGAALTGAYAFRLWVTPGLPGDEGEGARAVSDVRSVYMVMIALAVLVVGGVLELLLQASNIGQSITDTLDTRWGERWTWRNALLVIPIAAVVVDRLTSRPVDLRRSTAALGLLAAVGYLAITSSVSHAAAGGGAFWAAFADFVHLIAASVWIGMLALLAMLFLWSRDLPRGEKYGVLATALQRFSTVAVASVALLIFTGTVSAVIEVGSVTDLVDTAYGRALLVKLVLIVPLLALGAMNAYLLRPRLVLYAEGAGDSRTRPQALAKLEDQLGRSVRWEGGIAVAVLVAVAVLIQLTPTRGPQEAGVTAGKFTDTQFASGVTATLVIDPNQAGVNTFEVYVTGGVDVIESVRLNFLRNNDPSTASRLVLDASRPPVFYVGRGPFLNEGGRWDVTVDMRRSRGSDLAIPFQVRVPDAGGSAVQTQRRGGSLDAPMSLSTTSTLLLALSGAVAVALVVGSVRLPGLPAGYLGIVMAELTYRLGGLRPRSTWSLVGLVMLGTLLGLWLGSHVHSRLSPEQATAGNPVESSPASVERGRILFAANCTQCHGESGRGDGPLVPTLPLKPANLYEHVPYHPDQFFFNVITNGLSGIMPAFGSALSEEDRWNLLNYLRATFTDQPAQQ